MEDHEKRMRERLGWMLGEEVHIQVAWFEGVRPCAVCGETCEGRPGDFVICRRCGWEEDQIQEEDPDYRGGANTVSVNDARENYARTGMADPLCHPERLRQLIETGLIQPIYVGYCSVCGHTLPGYLNMGETCPACGWVDEPWHDEDPDNYSGCRNKGLTLSQARERFRREGRWQPEGEADGPAGR